MTTELPPTIAQLDYTGPWEVMRFQYGVEICVRGQCRSDDVLIASIALGHPRHVVDAHAQLIAAAPTLLEQLNSACRALQRIGLEHQIEHIPELSGIRAAIALATQE